jgi:hypothetical protein
MVSRKLKPVGETVCTSCGLLTPNDHMTVWREKVLCRAMNAFRDAGSEADPTAEEWVKGLYRYYYVTHEHPVCLDCEAHLARGGQLASPTRNRSKMAVIVLIVIVGIVIAALPWLLPHLKSALWLNGA